MLRPNFSARRAAPELPPPPARSPPASGSRERPSCRLPSALRDRGGPAGGDEAVLVAVSQSHRRRGTRGVPAWVRGGAGGRRGPQGLRGPRPSGRSRGSGLPSAVDGRRWRRVQDPLRSVGGRPREVLGQSGRADQLVQALDQNAGEQIPPFHELVSDSFAKPDLSRLLGHRARRPLRGEPGTATREIQDWRCAQIFRFVFHLNFIVNSFAVS